MKQIFSTTIALILIISFSQAQNCSGNATIQFVETFGTGNNGNGNDQLPAGRTTLKYKNTNKLEDGQYKLNKTTHGKPEWHDAPDHTGDNNGLTMVINADFTPSEFYRDTIENITDDRFYQVYLYIMNVNTPGTCGSNPKLPKVRFKVESYNPANNSFSELTSFTSNMIPQTANPTWVKIGGAFYLPTSITTVRYIIYNDAEGGCGNDLAIDDITFASCTPLGILPVTGFQVDAYSKNGTASVNWSTQSEQNSDRYEVERSRDGINWNTIATVKAAGTSNTKQTYHFDDMNAIDGTNYYRIKQIDLDGRYTYSSIVTVKISKATVKVTTYPNPFVSAINFEIVSDNNEKATIHVRNQQGQVVKQFIYNLKKGFNKFMMDDMEGLSKGIYLIDVQSQNGTTLYTAKQVK